ncbi:putative glycoside hydrolase [Kocuria sp.]|uniref:putative glycoside hydrolase n=1 Tax=Kocuria sp. TaxID=1871328 RepID=UPI0026DCB927|nr:putative glycoside hydrolase [Kocuria sp.]MDO4918277.1 putative glycoside hydrolase [Kocuria sp.]
MSGVGAWIRYGDPVTPSQVDFAVEHYRAAILQPWETAVAAELKARSPGMTVLCYKCLSSTRSYEPGPVYSSGVSHAEAPEQWFAHRLDGGRIQWRGYGGHWQMALWEPAYRERWVANVTAELADSPFDGVMADNDVFDDYYGLDLPLQGIAEMAEIRAAAGELVAAAGAALNAQGKLLVPNIAESRREPGRWRAHAAYGGGFEEVWLGYGPQNLFDPVTAQAQLPQLDGPGITIVRVPTDGDDHHPNMLYGLAAFWIFGGGRGAYTATAHDDYSRTQHVPQLDWDLGAARGEPRRRGQAWSREFENGWAAVNFHSDGRRRRRFPVPRGMVDAQGAPVGRHVVVPPHRGVLLRRG